jgi:hypothetical protein
LFILLGHVTDTSIVNFPAGSTEDGDNETVQSLLVVFFTVVVVVVVAFTVVVGATVVEGEVVVVGATVVVVVVGATVVVVVVVGTTVSYAIVKVVLAVFPFAAASVNTPAPTEIDAVPDALDIGVNVTVYVVPEPLNPDNVPPETVMSPTRKSVEASDNIKVNTSVLLTPNEPDAVRVIETVGGVVSVRVS